MTPRYISRRYFRDACDYVVDFLDHEPNDHRKALPTVAAQPAAARSAGVYLIRHLLYLGQRAWVEWIPLRFIGERLYEFIYVKPLPNATSFSLGGFRVLKLFSRIVLQRHDSVRSALASLPAFARAVSREDNTELAPDWIINRGSGQ